MIETLTVTFEDVQRAAEAVGAALPPTPAWSYPALNATAGCDVIVKHENTQPTGAFKVRGGLALVSAMPAGQLARGLVTASTGNHAQSIAYAARRVGTVATVVVPETAPACKVEAVRMLGATVVTFGPTMKEAAEHARELAEAGGLIYVDPGNTPAIIAGHATVYLELLTRFPDLQAIYVPIGSGTGAAGACVVRDRLAPDCRIIGVQSSAAPAAYDSWTSGRLEAAPCHTRHSGLATGSGFALPQSILGPGLHDFLLVDDDEIADAASILAHQAHTLAEGAGAASLAGLLRDPDHPERCAVICTGGNASPEEVVALGARSA
ncbi:MAG TPA: pyridoxal-phosphate dependent enzyme [Propionicimonas sp.]|uniref:threonine ammonia-lyase n=1 Tax=Propionicimonas sp. TaxID=1955623 RepID=UPI002F3F6CB8